MKNVNNIIKNIIIFILLIVITFLVIFNNHDFTKAINILFHVKPLYVFLGILAMSLYFVLEGLNVRQILIALGNKISLRKAIKFSLIGFFFSGITPASGGGQPMEVYYMSKEKIPVRDSTIALLVQLCFFKIMTILVGLIGGIIYYNLLSDGSVWVLYVGLFLNAFVLALMLIGLFSKKLINKLVNIFLNFLIKLRIKKIKEVKEKIDTALDEYHESAKFIKSNKHILIKSFIIVFIQIMLFYLIPYFVYRAFDLSGYNAIEIILIQAMLFVSVASIPLPGSVGISESLFLKIYLTIFGIDILPSAMILNRFINFYLFILIGLVVVIVSSIRFRNMSSK